MMGEAEVTKWINPETKQMVTQRARDRAKAAMWDLDIAVFLFGVLIIVIILLFQGIGTGIVAPVAVLLRDTCRFGPKNVFSIDNAWTRVYISSCKGVSCAVDYQVEK